MSKANSTKFKGLKCAECAWLTESFDKNDFKPCDACIRNPHVLSKRWKGTKVITVVGVDLPAPRDMYISKDMLEMLKIIITEQERKLLESMLRKDRNPYPRPYPQPYIPPDWQKQRPPKWYSVKPDDKDE